MTFSGSSWVGLPTWNISEGSGTEYLRVNEYPSLTKFWVVVQSASLWGQRIQASGSQSSPTSPWRDSPTLRKLLPHMGVWVAHMLSTREDVGEIGDTPANMVPGADSADTQRCSQSDEHFAEGMLLAVSMTALALLKEQPSRL